MAKTIADASPSEVWAFVLLMQAGEPSARDRRYKNKGLAPSLRAGSYIPVRIGNSATHMHTQPGAPL